MIFIEEYKNSLEIILKEKVKVDFLQEVGFEEVQFQKKVLFLQIIFEKFEKVLVKEQEVQMIEKVFGIMFAFELYSVVNRFEVVVSRLEILVQKFIFVGLSKFFFGGGELGND